jgi:hypothetical protein
LRERVLAPPASEERGVMGSGKGRKGRGGKGKRAEGERRSEGRCTALSVVLETGVLEVGADGGKTARSVPRSGADTVDQGAVRDGVGVAAAVCIRGAL